MRMSVGKTLITAVLCVALTACGAGPAAERAMTGPVAARAAAPYCGITWGSGDKAAGVLSTAQLLTAETGRHDCWDRVVFEFGGSALGYAVRYSDQVPTEGQGVDLVPYTAGGAFLWVTLRAPASTFGAVAGQHVATVVSYDTLRDVVFGGTSEGYTTFAVGVRARLPFRVLTLAGPGSHSRVVVDVAHFW
ncbi:hypothetical protein GCM10010168_76830 [Actinoplanes ianthinogenes]|uniref:AMIN-like domain-containing protein n=1 Tax=Actinoplanes ianthinogenes TaxID=122358 RepID=A0ABM7M9P4_9ACTN|nr:hypothetical protein [Actinoplanes ianthinogenes]BCJ48391.1 hypothetical protein Aiant_90480 [Actinoplanes ianthinogenes]GGR46703.1 hypothetical protein GCM10010168_76830 [Actinoplanes ianthinogenes]